MAGHMGRKMSVDHILLRFYWPTLFQDVKEWCQTYPECQKRAAGILVLP